MQSYREKERKEERNTKRNYYKDKYKYRNMSVKSNGICLQGKQGKQTLSVIINGEAVYTKQIR